MGHLLGHRWFENPVYKHMVVPTKRSPKQSDKNISTDGGRGGGVQPVPNSPAKPMY